MKQLIAGSIVDNLFDVFEKNSSKKAAAQELTYWLSHFNFKSKSNFESKENLEYSSNLAVILNLLQRGLPTKLNFYALESLIDKSEIFKWDTKDDSSLVLTIENNKVEVAELIYKSLHIIEPRIKLGDLKSNYKESWEKLGSEFEENFLYNHLPNNISENGAFIIQLIASQRSIGSIVSGSVNTSHLQKRIQQNFDEQRTDFSIEFPYYQSNKPKGIVIEIDGSQHQNSEQQFSDTERDKAVANSGWNNTLRIKTFEFRTTQIADKIKSLFVPAVSNEYVKTAAKNYVEPIWNTTLGLDILQLTLIPFGVSRIQRTYLEYLAYNSSLCKNNSKIKIAVIERDVPCAKLALDDLDVLIQSLNGLSSEKLNFPQVELDVFSTAEFIKSKYQDENARPISDIDKNTKYDLVIDLSILERGENLNAISANSDEIITIRSVHYLTAKRRVATNSLISYNPFCNYSNDKGSWEISDTDFKNGIDYLLKSVFRKKEFRPGQLPIMHNALQCKSVIGLLPTGGGKSLTYQLSALLQPGICLVIDPIRSLMKDQVDGLNRNFIDSCVFINSTLQGEAKRKAMRKFAEGEVQFVFISPERLQMEEFRLLLNDMYEQGSYFSYCVIDEAHCVSEWGHDFRTAYLRLGENAINFCKTKNLKSLPLFGLTATASYDVLADVQRELSGNDESKRLSEESIVRSEYTKRNELQYIIEEVTFPTGALNNIWDLKKELSSKKQDRVKRLLSYIPEKIEEFQSSHELVFSDTDWENNDKNEQEAFDKMLIEHYNPSRFYQEKNAALIFCPHTKGYFGVTDKFKVSKIGMPIERHGYYDTLSSQPGINAGYFMGSGSDTDGTAQVIQEESFDNQDKFINSDLNLMVATKAFGMGIDKENIRYTIHVNYPSSIESYVQEAGRAGRDRKLALSYILFNDQEVKLPTEDELVDHDFDINMYFHKNSFKGVQKELAVLDELLTEIFFPDRTFELENIINNEFDENVKCNYWEGGNNKRLYINLNFNEPLGYIDLITLNGYPGGSVNSELSYKIFPLIKEYIQNQNLNEPAHLWIQRSDKQAGIEEILKSKNNGDKFSVTVGFFNNAKERVKTITKWLHDVLHNSFNEALVQKMRANCTDATAFIEQVSENFQKFTGNELDFETFCKNRDIQRGVPKGTAFSKFMALFNGYRDKLDTEKAIYRLSTLGIIDDYTVNFSTSTFSLIGTKKLEKEYKEIIRKYLCKYYSEKTTDIRLKALTKIDEPTTIRKYLNFLVNFVYKEIQKKRKLAMHDMKYACRLGLEKGSLELKDYIDLYFNSKYARSGYSFQNEKGEEILASLPDLTAEGKNDDLKLVWKFIDYVEEDPKAGQIDNLKHLRGACTRMLNNQPDSYTLLLLNAFTLYMLEFKSPRYLQEAENLLLHAFTQIEENESNLTDKKLEEIYNQFIKLMLDKNLELEIQMKNYGFEFDFDSIMIKRYLQPLKNAKNTLVKLNEILN
jgi:ATP-dependent DNA helicase RecQ